MTVVIVGCGDLGTEVGLRFVELGHRVVGIRRSPQKLPAAFEGVRADLAHAVPPLPADTDIIVVATSADRREEAAYRSAYQAVVTNLIEAMRRDGIQPTRVVFVSSTAVYGIADGSWVDEQTPAEPTSETAVVLRATEQELQTQVPSAIVLRLAGIYGPGRTRLIDQVREATAVVSDRPYYTNRIHRDDAAAAIVHLATMTSAPAPLYIGVDNEPAERGDVIRFLAERLGVAAPRIDAASAGGTRAGSGAGKRCSNALLRGTGFTFTYPSYRAGYGAVLDDAGKRHP